MKKLLILTLFICTTLFAKSVVVDGIAPIVTSKIDAKNQALLDAKIRAVESQIGVFVKSQTQMENFEIKYDYIEENIQGYVSNYEVLKESSEDNTFKIQIKADVKKGKVNKDIENLVSILNYKKQPKFIIVSKGDSMVASIFESNMKAQLLRNKIDLVDATKMQSGYKELISKGSDLQLVPYQRLGIDYVVFINNTRQNLSTEYKGQKHKSVNLFVTADVMNTSNFEIIVTRKFPSKANENRIIVESDLIPSTELIANSFAKKLIIEIVDKWNESMFNGENITITLNGLKNYQMMQEIKDYFQEIIMDIKSIHSKQYDKGTSTFDISIKGGLTKFLDELIFNNDKYQIEVTSQDANKCTLTIKH